MDMLANSTSTGVMLLLLLLLLSGGDEIKIPRKPILDKHRLRYDPKFL
jgi:hypothetical protein